MQTNGDKSVTRQLGHRFTVQEAAEILGTTVDGVRSRIRRGSLNSMKVSGTVYVLLDPDQAGLGKTNPDQSETSPDESTTGPLLEAKEETIAGLRDQVAYLREQLGQERDANRENRRIIAGLVQRIPELEAAPEPRDAHETAPDASDSPSPRPDTVEAQDGAQGSIKVDYRAEHVGPQTATQRHGKQSWWRRIFGG